MEIRHRFPKLLTIFFIVGYGIYVAFGYGRLYFLVWSTTLVEYAIHAKDNEKKWRLLPFVDNVSLAILENRSPEIIQQDFSHIGLTLGAVAGGFRYHSRELTPEQRQKSRELAMLMYNKGVGTGIEFVDRRGCTALQGAIIGKDADVAKFLLEIGGKESAVGNPNATLKPCQKDASTLATERGFELPNL